jgi:hypothetical protein
MTTMTTMTQTDIAELQKYRDISASYTDNGTADELQDFIEDLECEADEDNLFEKLYYSDNFEPWVRGSDLYSELEGRCEEAEAKLQKATYEIEALKFALALKTRPFVFKSREGAGNNIAEQMAEQMADHSKREGAEIERLTE